MSPEEMQRKIEDLERTVDSLRSSHSIPLDIGEAIIDRVSVVQISEDETSKSLTSEQHGAGAAGLKNPEAWLTIRINGTDYFIASYT